MNVEVHRREMVHEQMRCGRESCRTVLTGSCSVPFLFQVLTGRLTGNVRQESL